MMARKRAWLRPEVTSQMPDLSWKPGTSRWNAWAPPYMSNPARAITSAISTSVKPFRSTQYSCQARTLIETTASRGSAVRGACRP